MTKVTERGGLLKTLTKREREIFFLLLLGKAKKDIAAELYISIDTVKTHVTHILAKKEVHSSLELLAQHYKDK